MESQPDLVAFCSHYVNDPGRLQEEINSAGLANEDLRCRDFELSYRRQIPGAHHHFSAFASNSAVLNLLQACALSKPKAVPVLPS
jgi:hypothetical protein